MGDHSHLFVHFNKFIFWNLLFNKQLKMYIQKYRMGSRQYRYFPIFKLIFSIILT